MRPASYAFLERLLETPSPSGFEHEIQGHWLAYVKRHADRTWSDAYGNCFASLEPGPASRAVRGGKRRRGADEPTTVAICGHADEIGLMVNHVDDKGFVYCKSIGGIDASSIVGKRVLFRSSVKGVREPVAGVIGATAIHLQDKSAEGKVRKLHELFVDIGARDRDSVLRRLNIGDPGVFADGLMKLTDDLIVARALDNRIGIWAAAEALRLVAGARSRPRCRVVAVSTVQEEVGLRGASMIASSLRPTVALITDVGHATDSPGINHAQHGLVKLAGGPRISFGAAVHPAVSDRLVSVAARKKIPLQRAAAPGSTGTDTDAIFVRNGGIPCGLVSLPIRYMHTTVEMSSLLDLERIAEIFAGFCLDLTDGERFVSRP